MSGSYSFCLFYNNYKQGSSYYVHCILMNSSLDVDVLVTTAVRPAEPFPVAVFTIVSSAMSGNSSAVKTGSIVRVPTNQLLIMWIKMLDRGCC